MDPAAAEFSQIPMSQALAATLARALDGARATGSAEVSLEHALVALCDDPDAADVLAASHIDLARVRGEAIGYLAQTGAAAGPPHHGNIAVSPALKRILEAAAAAARGGRRRDINGAIVLAAIVGDGRSTAAQILQVCGLTFDEAIRALQSALAHPRDVPAPLPAEDVLARARERVQSRAAPSLRDIMRDLPMAPRQPALPPAGQGFPDLVPAPPSYDFGEANAAPAPAGPLPAQNEPAPPPAPLDVALAQDEAAPEPSPPEPLPVEAAAAPPPVVPTAEPPNWAPAQIEPPAAPEPIAAPPQPVQPPPPPPPPIERRATGPLPPPIPPMGGRMPQGSRPQAPGPMGAPQGGQGLRPGPNGSLNGGPGGLPPQARGPKPMPPPAAAPVPRASVSRTDQAELGALAENVPRTMRVGVSERVEIRIGRAQAKGLTEGMEGGGLAWRHDVVVTKAMSVRLRAPEGGFFIETASPETQWVDNQFADVGDDFASWRFVVTPQRRGTARLQIIVSARTVGADGLAAETAFPDQAVDVKVRTNYGSLARRSLGWAAAAILGGVLAKFGESAFGAASGLMSVFTK